MRVFTVCSMALLQGNADMFVYSKRKLAPVFGVGLFYLDETTTTKHGVPDVIQN